MESPWSPLSVLAVLLVGRGGPGSLLAARRGVRLFPQQPTSESVRALLGRTIRAAGTPPKHLVCDQGGQFWCAGFKAWAARRGIRLRFSAVGRHGGLAVIERFIGTLKREGTRRVLVPWRQRAFDRELALFIDWYNAHRPP